jgi:2-keto-4-pentenoate hydratase/2-oxohepta-3-ene-1,7-dioic acid hydratase in catechol pathway
MRYVSFHDGSRVLPGLLQGDRITAIACDSLLDYIALPARDRAARHTNETLAMLDTAGLTAPVRPHKNVFCVGRNYLEHAREGARALGRELNLPEVPTFFTKATTAFANPDAELHFEARISQQMDWEGELAVVIGKRVKDATEENAMDAIFGYMCLNDITARDLQRAHQQWFKGKSLDESCPMGPWIVGTDEIPDPHVLDISLTINGERKQRSNTSQMIFRIPRLIAELSRGMTLEPGDVIATGTPEGVGFARTPAEFFRDGDVVEVQIEKVGVLRNTIRIA